MGNLPFNCPRLQGEKALLYCTYLDQQCEEVCCCSSLICLIVLCPALQIYERKVLLYASGL